MARADDGAPCDWPACDAAAVHELPVKPGMTLELGRARFAGSVFRVCETHAPRAAQVFVDAIDGALRRHRARRNFAPGDAEWDATFGDGE